MEAFLVASVWLWTLPSARKRRRKIRHQATHDGLTGLVNYREFYGSLEKEVLRAERSHHSFGLLLLDLDDLKGINDRLGHLAGNRALRRLARVMKENCRASDIAARYGGDEFAILLIDADAERAQQIAQRIANRLSEQPDEPRLSVSIGSAVYIRKTVNRPRIFWKRRIAACIATRRRCVGRPRTRIEALQGIPSRITWTSRHLLQAFAQMCKNEVGALLLRSPHFCGVRSKACLIQFVTRLPWIINVRSSLESRRSSWGDRHGQE